ncbi:DUF3343 domain-containing protein [Desulfosporosinus sp. PR]|uniref:DUF3343 domain-containing protein n=1 Tax=Candidatus Desulfosporosinus nitrosoreducens TaxID=3401928 RepID=UPI0027E67A03|nr:DUF3343 domain-containing protein [Desulfosporosinus sp. PR]MDQ7093737.1 DUF3343 domain-containing protein [Desulfosporosinus sp. PR]
MDSSGLYFAVFFTTSGAMHYHKFLRSNNIPAEIMPVPRSLSISCAVGVRFSYNRDLNLLLTEYVKEIYAIQHSQYILKYNKGTTV